MTNELNLKKLQQTLIQMGCDTAALQTALGAVLGTLSEEQMRQALVNMAKLSTAQDGASDNAGLDADTNKLLHASMERTYRALQAMVNGFLKE